MKGYLDRIEDNKFAVILVEDIKKEFIIPKEELPEGSAEKSYFNLTIQNDQITFIKLDEHATGTEQNKTDKLMSKLRSKSNGSKFKKK
ncbi:DUF3006 domain-containing protein [Mesobacillus harenae]|uniref:DUF3006 domain-containing protein n=1 Tax=Mesobacillus harenae TaxID=2213203 RepID=UPI0015805BA7|nr:DUF3006 domain-containing protein [Mesobacillus harenae]